MTLAPIGAAATATPLSPPSPIAPTGGSFGALLEARASLGPLHGPPPSSTGSETLGAAFTRGLEGIERAQARLDGLLAAARAGRTFTPQELMALQGEAYRCSQTVELSAKLVEQGAQALKQALQAQV